MPVDWKGDEFMAGLRKDTSFALNGAVLHASQYAKRQMPQMPVRVTKSGIFFGRKMKGGKKVYTSSPPGGYPGRRTSHLANSMATARSTPESLVASFGVYGGAKDAPHTRVKVSGTKSYALYLEFGTKFGKNGQYGMKARPWAKPTVEQAPLAEKFQKALAASYKMRTGV